MSNRSVFLSAAAVLLAWPLRAVAHDMPSDAVVQMFAKPAGDRLELLVRLPLASLLNIDLPKRGTEYLDLDHIESRLRDAGAATASAIEVYQGDRKLDQPQVREARVSLPSDRSFEDYQGALAHVTGPRLSPETNIVRDQGYLDALFEYGVRPGGAEFAIRPHFASLAPRVTIVLRFLTGSAVRAFELGGNPGLVRLDPRWYQAAGTFVRAGILHIWSGTDHLLFLLCLIIPIRRVRTLIPVVTAFTVAHSITLIGSAYQLAPQAAWFPQTIEALIALSIVYMALENILLARVRQRWLVAFGFGLVHGFGFSFALRNTLQFAGSHLLTSLLSFNFGVEIGQLCVLGVLIPILTLIFRVVVSERVGVAVLSALACHTAWHWMIERGAAVLQIGWTADDLISVGRLFAAAVFVVSALVLTSRLIRHVAHTRWMPKFLHSRVLLFREPARSEASLPE
ncbi:MAG TPA: HupE/UreJ family protein [Bryobacteraceae bacterium]|nr:HupE/UreJ family protein [Bryobacteraceae bacterium]